MSTLLNLLYGIVLLFLLPWLIVRSLTTGRYRQGLKEKLLGLSDSPTGSKRIAWFHGVSLGEVQLLVTLVGAFRVRHPDWECVISTTTETGLAEAKRRFPDLRVVPWPFDFSWAVRRTIRAIGPSLIVLAESELWPNFLRAANNQHIPVIVVNGRMSPRSFRRYSKLTWLARPLLFGRITRFAMQSEGYAASMCNLGIPKERISVTGSIKYDGVSGDRNNTKTRELARLLGLNSTDRIWVAGSTHAPEEEIVLDVFRRLRVKHPVLRLILVPRSPDRFDEVAKMLDRQSFSFVRRSQIKETLRDQPAVILLDTIGELGPAWGLADIGFTGGSLDGKRGGQSMIEPAGYGVPVVFGPHVWNFRDAVARLLEADAAVRISTAQGLEKEIARLLDDESLRLEMGEAARKLVRQQQGATQRTLEILDEVMDVKKLPLAA
jgi:3-deoxy-D-manno-octulosonic-acid transferase